MPYIKQEDKDCLARGARPRTPGELTYLIYLAMISDPREATLHEAVDAAVQGYTAAQGMLSFAVLHGVVGSLECARREYIRRHLNSVSSAPPLRALEDYMTEFYWSTVAPYEEQKIAENGDVYA